MNKYVVVVEENLCCNSFIDFPNCLETHYHKDELLAMINDFKEVGKSSKKKYELSLTLPDANFEIEYATLEDSEVKIFTLEEWFEENK